MLGTVLCRKGHTASGSDCDTAFDDDRPQCDATLDRGCGFHSEFLTKTEFCQFDGRNQSTRKRKPIDNRSNMNQIFFLLFGACAFIAIHQVQCKVHVITKYEYITEEPIVVQEVHEVHEVHEVQTQDTDIIRIKLHIPGVTQILNAGLTIIAKLLRTAINVVRPVSSHGAAALDSILNRLEIAVENLVSVSGISTLITQLIGIVKDAIVGVEGIIVDLGSKASGAIGLALHGLLAGFHTLSGTLTTLQLPARLASGILG
uniref:Uncharacterized protein n=1 Tax=Strigamia maritima TaxID=126957 RepID=T1IT75_STRMM